GRGATWSMPCSATTTSSPSIESIRPAGEARMTGRHRHARTGPPCGRVRRRTFLADVGLGFTGLALGAMLHRDGVARAEESPAWSPPDGRPHFEARARSVIWIFLSGGVSHLETWDPKPALNKHAGKTYDATGLPSPFKSPLF